MTSPEELDDGQRTGPVGPSIEPAVLYAVHDDAGVTMRLRPSVFTDVSAGRVGVVARPGMRRSSWLATDLLSAMGCDDTVTGAGRPGEGDSLQVITWLQVNRIGDIYVQFAWDLPYPVLEDAIRIADRAGCNLWLVGDTPLDDRKRLWFETFDPTYLDGPSFLARWAHLVISPEPDQASPPAQEPQGSWAGGAGPRGTDAGNPDHVDNNSGDNPGDNPGGAGGRAVVWPHRVPEDDFVTFRDACRQLLPARQFEVVDERLRSAYAAALAGLVPDLDAVPSDVAAERNKHGVTALDARLADWIGGLWAESSSVAEFTAAVRGVQVALFRAGYHLGVELDQLIATSEWMPDKAVSDAATWQRLRVYPQPHRAAVCALAAADVGFGDIAALAVSSYNPNTGVATSADGSSATIPEAARMFVAAQQLYRRLQGAAEGDLLFLSSQGTATTPRALSTIVKVARRETGAAVASSRTDRVIVQADRVARRLGITVRRLP